MSVRTFESSELEPFPFPVQMSGYAGPAMRIAVREPENLDWEEECETDEIPTAVRCWRGLAWALSLEAVAAVAIYGIWHLVYR
ncbi:MAG: hypothetical protein WBE72_18900 [Terracidiphilus sp.]